MYINTFKFWSKVKLRKGNVARPNLWKRNWSRSSHSLLTSPSTLFITVVTGLNTIPFPWSAQVSWVLAVFSLSDCFSKETRTYSSLRHINRKQPAPGSPNDKIVIYETVCTSHPYLYGHAHIYGIWGKSPVSRPYFCDLPIFWWLSQSAGSTRYWAVRRTGQ